MTVRWYRVLDLVPTETHQPTSEELAEAKAKDEAETALRVSRTTFEQHVYGLLETPKKVQNLPDLLAYFITFDGYNSRSAAMSILGLEYPETATSFNDQTAWVYDKLRALKVETLTLVLFISAAQGGTKLPFEHMFSLRGIAEDAHPLTLLRTP